MEAGEETMKRLPMALSFVCFLVLCFWGLYERDLDSIFLGNTRISKELLEMIPTFPLGACALFVVLSARYGLRDKYWAYATIGALVGFWLRPQRA